MSSGTIPRPSVFSIDIIEAGGAGSIPDLLPYIQGLPDGITIIKNSNKPANRPTGGDWGGYFIFKLWGSGRAIYFNTNLIAVSDAISSSTTSITWGLFHNS